MYTPTVKTIRWTTRPAESNKESQEIRLDLTQSSTTSTLRVARHSRPNGTTLESINLSLEELECVYHLGKALFEQKLDLQQFLPESLRNNLTAE